MNVESKAEFQINPRHLMLLLTIRILFSGVLDSSEALKLIYTLVIQLSPFIIPYLINMCLKRNCQKTKLIMAMGKKLAKIQDVTFELSDSLTQKDYGHICIICLGL